MNPTKDSKTENPSKTEETKKEGEKLSLNLNAKAFVPKS